MVVTGSDHKEDVRLTVRLDKRRAAWHLGVDAETAACGIVDSEAFGGAQHEVVPIVYKLNVVNLHLLCFLHRMNNLFSFNFLIN
jgi:hypothetical protein